MTAAGTVGPMAPPRLGFWLASAMLVFLPLPGLAELPGGASLALLIMLLSMPIWYATARARVSPFDATATRAIAVILAAAGFLVVWSMLSAFGTDRPLRASRTIATLLAGFAFYFLIRGTITTQRLGVYIDILAVGLAVTSVLSLLAYDVGFLHRIIFADSDRAAGFFKNPNQFGMAISATLPAVTALALASRRRRTLRVISLVCMVLGLVASGSKTNLMLAWPTILITLCGYSILAYTGGKRVAMLTLCIFGSVAAAAAGALALALLNPRALAIMTEFLTTSGEVDSLTTRSYLWRNSLNQFLADPILGQGAGQRIDIFYRAADVSHSHNVLLDYMRTLGAPGLAGVSLIIGAVIVLSLMSAASALRTPGTATAGRVICLGLSLSSLSYIAANMSSDSFGPSTSQYFWIFTYMGLASRGLFPPRPSAHEALKTALAEVVANRRAALAEDDQVIALPGPEALRPEDQHHEDQVQEEEVQEEEAQEEQVQEEQAREEEVREEQVREEEVQEEEVQEEEVQEEEAREDLRRDDVYQLTTPVPTFAAAVERTLDDPGTKHSSDRYRRQWLASLERYAVPKLGALAVDEITPDHVFSVIEPIWLEKNATARRVRGRIEEVLRWAEAAGYSTGENPARWKDNLDGRMPQPDQDAQAGHHPALSLADAPGWYADLQSRKGNAARALEFAVLTAARSGAVRNMTWAEIDLDRRVWIVPAARVKLSHDHRVPLSEAAIEMLQRQEEASRKGLVFPAPRGGILSDKSVSAVMRRMHTAALKSASGYVDGETGRPAVPSGLRLTFREWVAKRTGFRDELAEIALAHKLAHSFGPADEIEQRRQMMDAWAVFLSGEAPGSVPGFE